MAHSPGVLIFGGTFDPPHAAHTQLPPIAAKQLGCERVIYVPAAINPLKVNTPPTADAHRLAMVQLATRDLPSAEVSTIELDRSGASYMIDTLKQLQPQLSERAMYLLIGCDQALDFHRWKDWKDIMQLATPAVMIRPPWDRASFEGALRERFGPEEADQWLLWTLDLPRIDMNATEIRRQLAAGESVGVALDPHVHDYITRHGLYRET